MTTPTPPAPDGDKPKERNDNSNPQQGTGGNRLRASPPVMASGYPQPPRNVTYSRPSLKIPPTQRDERKLFVGGLPANVTSEEFRVFFEGFGPVMDSIVLVDKTTNRSRGFGFVTFEDSATAQTLLAMGEGTGRLEMQGKMIEVKAAQPKESQRRAPNDNNRYEAAQGLMQPATIKQPNMMVNHQALPPPPAFGHQQQQPYYQAPPGQPVFAGYVAPMYYHMPPPQEMAAEYMPYQQPPVMMDAAMSAAYTFVPAVYGMPPPPPPAFSDNHHHHMMNPMDDGMNQEMQHQ